MLKKQLAICGCASSGTSYMTRLMRANGLEFGHERLGPDGGCGFKCIDPLVDTSECFAPLHQVRNPVDSIASMMALGDFSDNFAGERCITRPDDLIPQIDYYDTKLAKTMKVWRWWNRHCEERSAFTYRIEDPIDEILGRISKHIGVDLEEHDVDRGPHRKESPLWVPVTWELLKMEDADVCEQIEKMALRYGYLE